MSAHLFSPRTRNAVVAGAALLLCTMATSSDAQVRRAAFHGNGSYLVVEALDDDLLHFEIGPGTVTTAAPIGTSIMVHKRDYAGPRSFRASATMVETGELAVQVTPATLCFTVTDKVRRNLLTSVCPVDIPGDEKALSLARGSVRGVYGLGEQFTEPGTMNGDWLGRTRTPGVVHGNRMVGFHGGAVGNAMFPIMYAVGARGMNYAIFLDGTYAQRWDFQGDPWQVRTRGEQIRGYFMSGPDLPDLRRDYIELVGAPPVPPKKALGLWVSEYGYEHWHELETKLATLRQHRFPVDGFVLDLQWFGGIITDSDRTPMGSLSWDLKRFPHPAAEISRLRSDEGLGLIPIEEPYIGRAIAEHDSLEHRGFLVRQRAGGPPVYLTENPWWGKGGMVDFTNDAAGAFWHDWKRQPLVDLGVTGHWTDLGEPELYDSTAWYHGVLPGKHQHADVHNVYNLKWSHGVFDGYRRHGVRRRPLILSRSGTSGSQRYGVSMWSGDIGANLPSLATHMNVQMHMSMSGMDYFGSDIGGFHRGSLQGDSLTEVYTQWFASGALLDVPVRVHAENLCNCKETAPDRAGHRASNLANLRLRYALTPYYYTLAHRARTHAEPVVGPLVHYYQNDTTVRGMADQKLIGRDLLVAVVADFGRRQRDVYLPHGTWHDFRTHERLAGGRWVRDVPLYADNRFRLPLYARAGAIIPMMHVDGETMNVMGKRIDGSRRDELIVRVYPHAEETRFALTEDDGETIAYEEGAVGTTPLSQRATPNTAMVTVGARQGTYADAPSVRASVVELATPGRPVTSVALNGVPLTRHTTREALDAAGSGWYAGGDGLVIGRSAVLPVSQARAFVFRFD